jgi:hypothetical protein
MEAAKTEKGVVICRANNGGGQIAIPGMSSISELTAIQFMARRGDCGANLISIQV